MAGFPGWEHKPPRHAGGCRLHADRAILARVGADENTRIANILACQGRTCNVRPGVVHGVLRDTRQNKQPSRMMAMGVSFAAFEAPGPGTRFFRWDGRDGRGLSVPSGVYFYNLKAPGIDESRRMILLP